MRTIAKALRALREDSGLGQRRLAAKLEVQKNSVQSCERAGANPSWATIRRYIDAVGADGWDLALALSALPDRVMVANGEEVIPGEIEDIGDAGVRLKMKGRVVMRADNQKELLARLPAEVSVYGLIR